jgi:hypothetical protein
MIFDSVHQYDHCAQANISQTHSGRIDEKMMDWSMPGMGYSLPSHLEINMHCLVSGSPVSFRDTDAAT